MSLSVLGRYIGDVLAAHRMDRAVRRTERELEARAQRNHRELMSAVKRCEQLGIPVNLPFDLLTGIDKGANSGTTFQFKLLHVAPYFIGKYQTEIQTAMKAKARRAARVQVSEDTGPMPAIRVPHIVPAPVAPMVKEARRFVS